MQVFNFMGLILSILCILLLTQNATGQFSEKTLISSNSSRQISEMIPFDSDSDGDRDLLLYSDETDKILFAENIGNEGKFKTAITIASHVDNINIIDVVDLNNDQLQDILFFTSDSLELRWIKQLSPGVFDDDSLLSTFEHPISNMSLLDLDGDNLSEIHLVFGVEGKISSFQFSGNETIGSEVVLIDDLTNPASIIFFDMDYDNDEDILLTTNTQIKFLENTGDNIFTDNNQILKDLVGPTKVQILDYSGDNHLDVLVHCTSENILSFFENQYLAGGFNDEVILLQNQPIYKFDGSDIDNDGDLDIIISDADAELFFWLENENNLLVNTHLLTEEISVSDFSMSNINQDGVIDFIATRSDPNGRFDLFSMVSNNDQINHDLVPLQLALRELCSIAIGDINGDGKKDIVGGTKLLHIFKSKQFEPYQYDLSTKGTSQIHDIYLADIDGDGDQDVIYSTPYGIIWRANIDGEGNFGGQNHLPVNDVINFSIADVDNDGDIDVVTNRFGVNLYLNVDGNGTFEYSHSIHSELNYWNHYRVIEFGDMDSDGDLDLILGIDESEGKLIYFENIGGEEVFAEGVTIIGTYYDLRFRASKIADIDGDGDLDIVICTLYNGIWYVKNTDGLGNFSEPISTPSYFLGLGFMKHVEVGDIDNDGDQDIVSVDGDSRYFILENEDGAGNFVFNGYLNEDVSEGAIVCLLEDFNQDGDVDLFTGFYNENEQLSYYENSSIIISSIENTEPINSDAVRLYPNPFDTEFILSFEQLSAFDQEVSVKIFDLSGQLIFNQHKVVLDDSMQISITDIPAGLYYVQLTGDRLGKIILPVIHQ